MTDQVMGLCPECGQERMLWVIREDIVLCDECADNQDWIQCDICKDFFPYDAVEFTEIKDGRIVCEYCMEEFSEE